MCGTHIRWSNEKPSFGTFWKNREKSVRRKRKFLYKVTFQRMAKTVSIRSISNLLCHFVFWKFWTLFLFLLFFECGKCELFPCSPDKMFNVLCCCQMSVKQHDDSLFTKRSSLWESDARRQIFYRTLVWFAWRPVKIRICECDKNAVKCYRTVIVHGTHDVLRSI